MAPSVGFGRELSRTVVVGLKGDRTTNGSEAYTSPIRLPGQAACLPLGSNKDRPTLRHPFAAQRFERAVRWVGPEQHDPPLRHACALHYPGAETYAPTLNSLKFMRRDLRLVLLKRGKAFTHEGGTFFALMHKIDFNEGNTMLYPSLLAALVLGAKRQKAPLR